MEIINQISGYVDLGSLSFSSPYIYITVMTLAFIKLQLNQLLRNTFQVFKLGFSNPVKHERTLGPLHVLQYNTPVSIIIGMSISKYGKTYLFQQYSIQMLYKYKWVLNLGSICFTTTTIERNPW